MGISKLRIFDLHVSYYGPISSKIRKVFGKLNNGYFEKLNKVFTNSNIN